MRMRIDDLARRTGSTARNVRAYQERGLLPAPELVGRTGFYTDEHVRRLELIHELQHRGFSLEAIRLVLDTWVQGGGLGDLLGLERLVALGPAGIERQRVTLGELLERFPDFRDRPKDIPAALEQAIELGLLERVKKDVYEVVGGQVVLDAATVLAQAGVPLEDVLNLVGRIRPGFAMIADQFLDLVREFVIDPATEDGEVAADRVSEVIGNLDRIHVAIMEVVRPFAAIELFAAAEATIHQHGLGGGLAAVDQGEEGRRSA